jgi:hypothetical protein
VYDSMRVDNCWHVSNLQIAGRSRTVRRCSNRTRHLCHHIVVAKLYYFTQLEQLAGLFLYADAASEINVFCKFAL